MKNRSKYLVIAGLTLLTGSAIAQKKSETDAALSLRSFETAMGSQDMVSARKSILKAKEFVDLAAAHPDTDKSPKTLFLKGEIYASIYLLRALNDAEFNASTPANAIETAITAYNTCYVSSDKYDGEIEQSIYQGKGQLDVYGSTLVTAKKYEEAMEIYQLNSKFSKAINQTDTTSLYYAGICAENAEKWAEAAELYRQCANLGYKPESIYRSTASAYIQAKQNEKAIEFLDQAIVKAPNDKLLYFTLGTIAMDFNDDEKVKTNLNKAIEIDPSYSDAYFNLGSYFFGKGADLRNKANDLPPAERKQQDELLAQSVAFYNLASPPLEKYVALVPTDKAVIKSLFQIFRAVKNTEKEAQYKKLYDESK